LPPELISIYVSADLEVNREKNKNRFHFTSLILHFVLLMREKNEKDQRFLFIREGTCKPNTPGRVSMSEIVKNDCSDCSGMSEDSSWQQSGVLWFIDGVIQT